MITRKRTFFLGIFIFLIPFLGVPTPWKTLFIVLSGIGLVIMSVKIALPKKQIKTKTKKGKITSVFVENSPIYPSENKVEPEVLESDDFSETNKEQKQ